jgi:hypothetical protein
MSILKFFKRSKRRKSRNRNTRLVNIPETSTRDSKVLINQAVMVIIREILVMSISTATPTATRKLQT